MELTILGISFVLLLLLGVPVAFAIGLSAMCAILYEGLPIAVLFQQMMSGMNIFSFLAIPFFLFSAVMGSVMMPMMKKEAYHTDYAVNVTTHASLVGALMPTSHNMIIYSLAAGGKVSIDALIAAGVVPA